jgi:ADP-heptose:LPS heptosyltransferase
MALDPQADKRIVISVWPGIGDVVFATPVFRVLRKKFPNSWITVLVWSKGGKEILSPNPYINEVVEGSITKIPFLISKFKNYDVSVQCSHPVELLFFLCRIKKRVSFNNNPFWWLFSVDCNDFHSTEYYLQAIDKIDSTKLRDTYSWDIFIPKEDKEVAQKILDKIGSPVVAIHPGGRCNKNKRWSIYKIIKLCDSLASEFGAHILLIGGKADKRSSNYIVHHTKACALNLAGTLTLLQSAAVIEKCNLFVGHASGPTHIAAAVGTPVVAIYGADDPQNFGPIGKRVKVVSSSLPCSPCFHFYRNFFWGLRLRYIPLCRAMRSISVESVLERCAQFLR